VPASRSRHIPRRAGAANSRLEWTPTHTGGQGSGSSIAQTLGTLIARFTFVAVALAFAYGGFRLVDGPTFHVARVEVRGAYYLDAGDVQKAANVTGAALFRVSAAETERRVLSLGVPRDVTVSFRLPDVVVVSLKERTAAYLWRIDSTTYAVADDGTVLGRARDVGQRVVVVASGPPVKVGDRVNTSVLREASYLAQTFPSVAGFAPNEVRYSEDLGVVVPTKSGIQIIIGDDQQLDRKVAAVPPALSAALAQTKRPSFIDLRVPGRPVLR
jgi:cell division septal protein FtsQ